MDDDDMAWLVRTIGCALAGALVGFVIVTALGVPGVVTGAGLTLGSAIFLAEEYVKRFGWPWSKG